jgi:hypothetical protein
MISRSEPDSALIVCFLVAAGLVSISLAFAWDETLYILDIFKNWIVSQISDPAQALQTFENLEYKRLTSFETAFLSPIYLLMAAYPTTGATRSASRSWPVLLVIAILFGSVANTFGFYFFDFFMARCILFDGARKGVPSWHSVLLCAAIGAHAGWLSNKATALFQQQLATSPPPE